MLSRLIFIFVAVPLLELVLLLRIGQWIGLMPTLALVVTTGVAGAALAPLLASVLASLLGSGGFD